MNRTILEAVRAMLSDSKLPKTFWAEAVSTAVYVKNRSPTSAHKNLTPYQALNGHKPNVQHFRTFGCMAYAHVPRDEREKLDSKSKTCKVWLCLGNFKQLTLTKPNLSARVTLLKENKRTHDRNSAWNSRKLAREIAWNLLGMIEPVQSFQMMVRPVQLQE
ncbi:Ribonuclease H-like domain [Trinorchestia longiramus]|nr:Ribonuclease H-like domain [Trinorchestia longiramus]